MEKLFDLLLAGYIGDENLYCRKHNAISDGGNIIFSEKGVVSFDTYFNCFSFTKIKEYTTIQRIRYSINSVGKFIARIYVVKLSNDLKKYFEKCHKSESNDYINRIDSVRSLVFEKTIENDDYIDVDFSSFDGTGYFYLEIESIKKEGILKAISVNSFEPSHKKNKIAVVICTYKREEYVKRNVGTILKAFKENSRIRNAFDVIIIDNGQTLDLETNDKIKIFKNKNYGGSGGFTRGIMEVSRAKCYTHFLLQDDDIIFYPSILEKVLSFLNYSKHDDIAIGSSMIVLDKPSLQFELGAQWNGINNIINHGGYDLSNPVDLLMNETSPKTDYSAWWFLCSPVSVVASNGLPLPFFIKADDIEYGVRTLKNFLLVNGIGVWHESFDSKYSGELEYYITRNEFITGAIHNKPCILKLVKRVFSKTIRQCLLQRYQIADLIFRGVYDFLKGYDYFNSIESDKFHIELSKQNIKKYNKEELKEMGFDISNMNYYVGSKNHRLLRRIALYGFFIPSCFYNHKEKKDGRLVYLIESKPKDIMLARKVIHFDEKSGKGFVTVEKKRLVLFNICRLIKLLFVLLIKYRKVANGYLTHLNEIASFEAWENKLF